MSDYTRTNTGYKYNWLERHIEEIILFSGLGLFLFFNYNWIEDTTDRQNFCNSILPIEGFNNYQKNKLENEYCYSHINEYPQYEDRYFNIPPREYK